MNNKRLIFLIIILQVNMKNKNVFNRVNPTLLKINIFQNLTQ